MELDGLLPHSQEPATLSYIEGSEALATVS
jgi:hypothetical protein